MKWLYPLVTAFLFCSTLLFAQPRHPFVWQKCFGGFADEGAKDALIFADETAVIVGSTNSTDGDVTGYHQNNNYTTDGWVVKIDTDGNIIWQKAVGGSDKDVLAFVKPGADNSCYCIGYSSSTNGDIPNVSGENKLWIIKLDSSGNIIWSKVYDSVQTPTDAVLLSDGSLAIIANAVVKISSQGDLLWKTAPASFGNYLAEYNANAIISSGGYSFNSNTGAFQLPNWNFPAKAYKAMKAKNDTLYFAYDQLEINDPCNNLLQYIRAVTDTSTIYTENKWHTDFCLGKFGDRITELAASNGLYLISDSSFAATGKTTTPLDYSSSAFFYHNGFYSEYGTNMESFNSVKAYAGERTFLCVGQTASYDDWDFQGNYNTATSDVLVVKLSALCAAAWMGSKSNDWNDKDNWSNNEVPYMGTIVTIPAGTPNNPVVNNDAACYSIKLEPGATIKVNDGYTLTITGRKRVY